MGIRGTNRFLSMLCTVSGASFCILDIQTHFFFRPNEAACRISYFDFQAPFEKLEMRGIDPRTSRMLSEHSTIWATSPLRKRGANAISNLSSVKARVERSSFAYRSENGFVVAGHQSMCFSHANRLPFRLTCLAGGVQKSCLFYTVVFDSLISGVMCPSTLSEVNHGDSGHQSLSEHALYCFRCFLLHIGHTNAFLLSA